MTQPLLTRQAERDKPALRPHADIHLTLARVHEACGPARRTFAMWLAGQMQDTVLWIAPAWEPEQLNPDGMLAWADPARFLFVHPKRPEDVLWCMEEALRSGVVPLVVADVPGLPGLTPVRRMHLAAETGAELGNPPLGLLLTPGEGGAQGIESRWHMAGAHQDRARRWRLERRRARTQPVKAWIAEQTGARQPLSLAPTPAL
ncbi:MAG: ImuA family protein [Paracoccaceae bacterium]